ncbi:unnamed protein product [Linum trigynum]|uniref:Uncharacterized protein n=1 Tax=Linum trigynum TaxID=586398 RepID=A0AAV2G0Y8_9ROSI
MEGKFVAAVLAVLLLTTAGMMGSASARRDEKFTKCYNDCMKDCGKSGSLEVCISYCTDKCTPQSRRRFHRQQPPAGDIINQ